MDYRTGKLNKTKIAKLGPGRHSDGNGLFLVAKPAKSSGGLSKHWIVRLTIRGARNANGGPMRTDLGLGGLRDVTPEQAREKAHEFRQLAYQGVNPRFVGQQVVPTFKDLATRVHKDRLPTWANPKHADQFINTLETYAFPVIGGMRVSDIGQPEVLRILSPIWTIKHETARRVSQRVATVLDVAEAEGHRSGKNPVQSVKDARVLPRYKPAVKNHAASPWQDVPSLYAKLTEVNGMAARALRFTILSASRTTEVLHATWPEFDLEKCEWVCPAHRMKAKREHTVFLTDPMVEIINPLMALRSEFVFEGQKRNRPLSNMAMTGVLKRLKIDGVTVHGFRSSFRTWASERAKARFEVAEACLAYSVGNKVSLAYDRSTFDAERKELWRMDAPPSTRFSLKN